MVESMNASPHRCGRILVGGAGGAPSEGVIRSLLAAERYVVSGMGSVPTDLALSHAPRRYVVPFADAPRYKDELIKVLRAERPDLLHVQNDLEVFRVSQLRDDVAEEGVSLFMPRHEVVDRCVHKFESWKAFRDAGLAVPENILIEDRSDLVRAFDELGDDEGRIWLRSVGIGGGGAGSIPTSDFDMARCWIDRLEGWGSFAAAEMLTSRTVTWMSIWRDGELVVAQSRRRSGWIHGSRSASGVTGVTKVGETCSDPAVDDVARRSVLAVDDRPHGIYGVDMCYDRDGVPNPTEINISRFFTTIWFFTRAGLNMPAIFADLALGRSAELPGRRVNPLPDGLMWLRGMDTEPLLVSAEGVEGGLTRL